MTSCFDFPSDAAAAATIASVNGSRRTRLSSFGNAMATAPWKGARPAAVGEPAGDLPVATGSALNGRAEMGRSQSLTRSGRTLLLSGVTVHEIGRYADWTTPKNPWRGGPCPPSRRNPSPRFSRPPKRARRSHQLFWCHQQPALFGGLDNIEPPVIGDRTDAPLILAREIDCHLDIAGELSSARPQSNDLFERHAEERSLYVYITQDYPWVLGLLRARDNVLDRWTGEVSFYVGPTRRLPRDSDP